MIQSYVYKYLFFFKFFSQLGCYRILSRVLYAVQYIPLQIGCESESCSVVSDSLRPHGLYSPWNSPGQNTGVGSHSLLQGIFPIQGSNQGLLIAGRFFTSWATREALPRTGGLIKKTLSGSTVSIPINKSK